MLRVKKFVIIEHYDQKDFEGLVSSFENEYRPYEKHFCTMLDKDGVTKYLMFAFYYEEAKRKKGGIRA